jgi:hypothetical protein
MKTSENKNINNILSKMGLTEEEAEEFISYFFVKYMSEKCNISLSLDTHTSHERDNTYINVVGSIIITNDDGVILSSDSDTSTNIS